MGASRDANGHSPASQRLGPITPTAVWRPVLKADLSAATGGPTKGKFVLEASQVAELLKLNDMDMDTLLQALVTPAATLALPYMSNFYVGAVGLGASGRVYMGGNMEFAGGSLANSIHAEQCLMANLLFHGERELVTVAISAPPCGHCRQFFSEMRCADTFNLIFGKGPHNKYKLAEILPHRFGPHDLLIDSSQPLLLQPQSHKLTFTEEAQAELDRRKSEASFQEAAAAALTSASQSYSPYRRSPSGAAVVDSRGAHSGGCVENAAHNPSLPPLQAAFVSARIAGLEEYSEVQQAVLVELRDAQVRHAPTAAALMEAVFPGAELIVLTVEAL